MTERSTIPVCPSFIAIVHKGNTENTVVRFLYMFFAFIVFFLIMRILFFTCQIKFVKSPEVTLCGWPGYKPPINNQPNSYFRAGFMN